MFSRQYDRGLNWYLARFDGSRRDAAVGGKSNSCLDTPCAAERITRHLPAARLVVPLRNPVDRASSDDVLLLRHGEVDRDFKRALDPRRASGDRFLRGGRYAEQIEAFLGHDPTDATPIVHDEDLKHAPVAHVASVRSCLEVPAAEAARPAVAAPVKDKRTPMLSPAMRAVFRPLKWVVKPLRGTAPSTPTACSWRTPWRPPVSRGLSRR